MTKEEMSSLKTCIIPFFPLKSTIDDQISEMLSLSCTAMDLMTETEICFEKVHLNFLYHLVLENNALQRTTSNGVRDYGR